MYSDKRWLETRKFGYKKKRNCAICVAKTKALISCAVTAQQLLICIFVFAYADCCFSDAASEYNNVFIFMRSNGKISAVVK